MNAPPSFSALELEAYLIGELSAVRRAVIDQARQVDPVLSSWLAEREAEHKAFAFDQRRRPFSSLVEEAGIERKKAPWRSIGWASLFAAGAAAALAVTFLPKPQAQRSNEINVKGGLSARAAIEQGGRIELYDSGQSLHPGDRLRLVVDDPKGGFVTVLLQEASGAVELQYAPDELARIGPGTHTLPGSLALDGKLGRERLYILVSGDPPEVGVWMRELEAAYQSSGFDHGWLPAGSTRIATIDYSKVSPP